MLRFVRKMPLLKGLSDNALLNVAGRMMEEKFEVSTDPHSPERLPARSHAVGDCRDSISINLELHQVIPTVSCSQTHGAK